MGLGPPRASICRTRGTRCPLPGTECWGPGGKAGGPGGRGCNGPCARFPAPPATPGLASALCSGRSGRGRPAPACPSALSSPRSGGPWSPEREASWHPCTWSMGPTQPLAQLRAGLSAPSGGRRRHGGLAGSRSALPSWSAARGGLRALSLSWGLLGEGHTGRPDDPHGCPGGTQALLPAVLAEDRAELTGQQTKYPCHRATTATRHLACQSPSCLSPGSHGWRRGTWRLRERFALSTSPTAACAHPEPPSGP